jgi:hypothetical protein
MDAGPTPQPATIVLDPDPSQPGTLSSHGTFEAQLPFAQAVFNGTGTSCDGKRIPFPDLGNALQFRQAVDLTGLSDTHSLTIFVSANQPTTTPSGATVQPSWEGELFINLITPGASPFGP